MRRTLALAFVTVISAAACSGPEEGQVAEGSPTATASATPVAPATYPGGEFDGDGVSLDGAYSPAQACEMADVMYRQQDDSFQKHVREGVAAERRGDQAAVAAALKGLQPVLNSTAATFADTAAKVADPALKTALNSLADASAKATRFTSFAEFDQMPALTAPGEAVLKVECPKAGYRLKNIQ
jgi:hypothetical protein